MFSLSIQKATGQSRSWIFVAPFESKLLCFSLSLNSCIEEEWLKGVAVYCSLSPVLYNHYYTWRDKLRMNQVLGARYLNSTVRLLDIVWFLHKIQLTLVFGLPGAGFNEQGDRKMAPSRRRRGSQIISAPHPVQEAEPLL